MKNLRHFDIEKIDTLPIIQKFSDFVNTNLILGRRKDYKFRYPYKCQLVDTIIEGSVGKEISDIIKE